MIDRTSLYMRDPYVLVQNGIYYLTGTTDKHWFGGKSDGLKIYTSKDLEHFSEPATVFFPRDDFWSYECWWAPELHHYNGRYYIFCTFTNKETERKGTQILESDDIIGEYHPISDELVTNEEWECLDATLYVEDSIPYAVYCREWTKIFNGEVYAQKLSGDLRYKIGEPIFLFDAKSAPWTVGLNNHDPKHFNDYITDAPFLYRALNGDLLMTWSSFSKDGYTVGIARSDNQSILGKFIHSADPLFTGDGGHSMIFKDLSGSMKLALHVNNAHLGSEYPSFLPIEENNGVLSLI